MQLTENNLRLLVLAVRDLTLDKEHFARAKMITPAEAAHLASISDCKEVQNVLVGVELIPEDK